MSDTNTKALSKTQRTAALIMRGKSTIETDYGTKRLKGLADLIDRESGLRDITAAARKVVSRWSSGDLAAAVRELDMLLNP